MRKVLIIGSMGMIGHQVYNYLRQDPQYTLFNFAHNTPLTEDSVLINLRDEKRLEEEVALIQPDFVVNCAGILIQGADQDLGNAIFLNSYLPNHLKSLGDKLNFKLIHISTDCVFSGERGQYSENDFPDGTGNYARTKGLGEINDPCHLTLRTSVIGPELKSNGHELFHWFMSQEGEIKGFTSAIWSGVTSLELAKAVKWGIEKNISGIYNITNGTPICKYDLLCLLKKETGKKIEIISVPGKKTNKSLVDNRKELNYQIPSYGEMISELIDLIRENKELYRQYNII
jgi:dTDP-4-dehydrorhamnose reductase